ncbi:Uncharacterised protein [Mycobacteroides abscessus subsp. abscessus]|nr:Uncharacterised protein [Mycobacteroides abscessus subsp. abscessus]
MWHFGMPLSMMQDMPSALSVNGFSLSPLSYEVTSASAISCHGDLNDAPHWNPTDGPSPTQNRLVLAMPQARLAPIPHELGSITRSLSVKPRFGRPSQLRRSCLPDMS